MNVLTYNPDALTKYTVIPLGRACECQATRIEFVVSSWLSRFPGGEIALYIKDPNEEMYLGDVRTVDGVASWVLRESDTKVPGYGSLELALIGANGEKKLSAVATTKLEASLVESETDAEYMQPWIERAAEIQAATQTAARAAATHAAVASAGASNAVEAQEAAEAAREAAEAAQEAAAESEKNAESFMNGASFSVKRAQDAANSAQLARNFADQSAEAASAAMQSATASAEAATASATTAAEEAERAKAEADRAEASANQAAEHAAQGTAAIESAKGAAVEAISDKGAEVLASIPEDYTKLAEDAKTHAPCIACGASGALVSMTDAAARDAVSVVSTIEPTVDGVSAITLTRTGRNLVSHLDYNTTNGHKSTIITQDVIDVTSPAQYDYGNISVPVKAGVTYTLVIDWDVYGRDPNSTAVTQCGYYFGQAGMSTAPVPTNANGVKRIVKTYSFDSDLTARLSWCPNYVSVLPACSRTRIMLLEGAYTADTAPAFEPGVKKILTATLPETVHGGTLDWVTGLLTITHDADGVLLAEPVTHQLDPQTLTMLKGYNAVWSDAGEVLVVYIADTKMYIDNQLAAIAAANLNV